MKSILATIALTYCLVVSGMEQTTKRIKSSIFEKTEYTFISSDVATLSLENEILSEKLDRVLGDIIWNPAWYNETNPLVKNQEASFTLIFSEPQETTCTVTINKNKLSGMINALKNYKVKILENLTTADPESFAQNVLEFTVIEYECDLLKESLDAFLNGTV
jgi:hypothetical protein